eukprot:CFRG0453T1
MSKVMTMIRLQGGCRKLCTQTAEPMVSGWFTQAPNAAGGKFIITRTHTKNVPVYEKVKQNGKVITEVRRVHGDVQEAVAELRKVVGGNVKISSKFNTITIHNGFYKEQVLQWAKLQGF